VVLQANAEGSVWKNNPLLLQDALWRAIAVDTAAPWAWTYAFVAVSGLGHPLRHEHQF